MDKTLRELISDVWNNQKDIMDAAPHVGPDSYSYMTDPSSNGGVLLIDEMMAAKEESRFFPNITRDYIRQWFNSMECAIKRYGLFASSIEILPEHEGTGLVRQLGHGHVTKPEVDYLSRTRPQNTYIRCSDSNANTPMVKQIYLNVKPAQRMFILNELLSEVYDINKFQDIKIAAPWVNRSDGIILEHTSRTSINDIVRNVVQAHSQSFDNGIRQLTKPLANLKGVSTGVAAPQAVKLRNNKGNNSPEYTARHASSNAGLYRAQLIFMALERTVRPTRATRASRWNNFKSESRLKVRVKTYFAEASIDVDKPWTQGSSLKRLGQNFAAAEKQKAIAANYNHMKKAHWNAKQSNEYTNTLRRVDHDRVPRRPVRHTMTYAHHNLFPISEADGGDDLPNNNVNYGSSMKHKHYK